jgi:photosystem II stability/assembly factor-like uncharacterized protein/chitodextrinase
MKRKTFAAFLLSSILSIIFITDFFQTDLLLTSKDFLKWKIEKKKNQKPTYGFPSDAMKMDYKKRAYPLGYIPKGWRQEALEHIQKNNVLNKPAKENYLAWTQLGPGNIPGRTRTVIIDPKNPSIIYSGSVSGGVWKTTNGGSSWFPLKDDMENLAVCSMVMDPVDNKILYAGTGEGYYNGDWIRGEGIFKTINSGNSWVQLQSTLGTNFYFVNKLEIDKTTNILWAATRAGLYYSTDGGNSFTAKLSGQGGSDVHCMDVEIAYTSPTSIYASFGQLNESAIYKSSDAGGSFSQNYTKAGHGRIEMAVSPSNPNIVYASFMERSSQEVGHFAVTNNGGTNWTPIKIPGPSYSGHSTYTGKQAWYDNILSIDPVNPNIVYAGGIDFWKSTDGGTNWTQKTNWYPAPGYQFAHADHHAIVFHPNDPNIMFLGTDGGIFKSTDKGEKWSDLHNNLYTTQFYYGAVDPVQDKFYGGTQDNGTLKTNGSKDEWFEIFGGDGGATEVDYNNPNNIYMEYVYLTLFKSTDGGQTSFRAMNGIPTGTSPYSGTTDRCMFIAPFSMDPNNPQTLVAGTYRVFRTTDGANSWTAISGDLTGDGTGSSGDCISTVIIAKGNSSVIYVGCENGKVQVTTNAGTNWNLRSSGLPNAHCSRIATYPSNTAHAIAVFSGYLENKKVFKTTDYGISWTNISSELPNIPVNCIFINPDDENNLYIGTDLGVFYSTNGGVNWIADLGLPKVRTDDLDYRKSDNKLFAATHGRSMYAAELTSGAVALASVDVNQLQISAKPNQTGSTSFSLSNIGGKDLDFQINVAADFGTGKSLKFAEDNSYNKKLEAVSNPMGVNLSEPQLLGNDILVLDDGNSIPDAFLGFNNGMDFGWANKFDLSDNGFKLEGYQFYERSEDAFLNMVIISVYDKDLKYLTSEYLLLENSASGKWFNGNFSSPIEFQDGESFYIFVETFLSGIDFPAGCDYNGQIAGNSFYMNYSDSSLVNLNTVSGFENSAFLIRAVGAVTAGINEDPVAVAKVSPATAFIGENINFDASDSYDNDGQITEYLWSFGDGSTSDHKIIDHSYSESKKYYYSLTVKDNEGATDQAVGEITIKDTANINPIAVADVSNLNPYIGEEVVFDASSSSDEDGQIISYLWNFGDGNTSTDKIAQHIYSQKNTFIYSLTVTDNKGAADNAEGQIVVKDTANYLTVDPVSGKIEPGNSVLVTVNLYAMSLPEGNYNGTLTISSNGGDINIPLNIFISSTVDIDDSKELPKKYFLYQNYPNPFNPSTKIKFEIPLTGLVNIEVFDISGKKVSTVINNQLSAGIHEVTFNGSHLASGVYIYRIKADKFIESKKLILVK